jgi:hypothetical protein
MGRLGYLLGIVVLFAATFAAVYFLALPRDPVVDPLAGTGIEKMGGKPLVHYVYIPKSEVTDERLFQAAESYCQGVSGCEVRFWVDKALTPVGDGEIEETPEQSAARFATYVKNRFTGDEVILRADREQAVRRSDVGS